MKDNLKEGKITENQLHWADEKEVISSNKPLKFLLLLFSVLPSPIVLILVFPVGFFYYLFSSRARNECIAYQKVLKEYTKGESPARISAYKQISSFCLCVLEKMQGWLGKIRYDKIVCHDDDIDDLKKNLENGRGAFLLGSHLGNIELLRSLSSFGENGMDRKISVTAIMEMKATEQFSKTLQEINPNAGFNVIDPADIGPDTICILQEQIENGGLVVAAVDRTSARTRSKCIRGSFLGKLADFPYGVFLMQALLKVPVYFCFGLRTKTLTLWPKYHMFVEKSHVDFNCSRSERESRIEDLCREFIAKLEKYCMRFPYQWYNFYNFWLLHEECSEQ